MKKLLILTPALFLATSSASAQLQVGDLVLAYPENGASTVQAYGAGGAPGLTLLSGDSSWISCALMPDGRIAVHNNSGIEQIIYFNQDGTIHSSFPFTVSFYASDIDAFASGELAVCSRFEGIKIFSDQGVLVNTLAPAGMDAPMGLQIQNDQTIWVADLATFPGNTDGKVWHLDSSGNVISSFDTTYDASDVAIAPDGTVWIMGYGSQVGHYQPDGTLIAQWNATIDSGLKTTFSLAVDGAGTVWISGHYDTKVRGYDLAGNVIQEFDTTSTGNSTFGFIVPGSNWIQRYCFGDGSTVGCPCANNVSDEAGCAHSLGYGAELYGTGSPDALADNLNFQAYGLVPNQSVLLFSADNAVQPGGPAYLFGDGFRCAGGNIKRLGVRVASPVGSAFWGPALQVAGGWGPGDVRRFQAWYRDPVGSPCGSAFNLSNGVEVSFLP